MLASLATGAGGHPGPRRIKVLGSCLRSSRFDEYRRVRREFVVQHRLGHGFQFSASYAFSKTLDTDGFQRLESLPSLRIPIQISRPLRLALLRVLLSTRVGQLGLRLSF